MNNIEPQLFAQFSHTLKNKNAILVGFSGGLDSTVLLHSLARWRDRLNHDLSIRAIHIHHGLNPRADSWLQHCELICQQLNVQFIGRKVIVDSRQKGIEGAARDARYAAFREVIQIDEVLVTAQHLDDQAETFLLALKRGSGPAGLSAMPIEMPFCGSRLVRPLLIYSRVQLEQYAAQFALSWVEDDSNQDTHYDRNFLRLMIIPELMQRWPHFTQAVARSAALCGEQESLLDELLQETLIALMDNQHALSIQPMLEYSIARRNALLRRWIGYHKKSMPSQKQLQLIWHEVALARQDAEPFYHLADCDIRRYQNKLWIVPEFTDLTAQIVSVGENKNESKNLTILLPDNLGQLIFKDNGSDENDNYPFANVTKVRAPKEDEKVTIRFGLKGQYRIVDRAGSRSAKKIWQEKQIAPWMRERIPLLYYNEILIAALNVFVTQEGDINQAICQQKMNSELYVYWITH